MTKKILFALSAVALFVSCSVIAEASEVFLMLSFNDHSKVYRVVTDDAFMKPIGYFFPAEPASGLYVDAYKDFRMIHLNTSVSDSWKPSETTIFRQVFDGRISDADRGIESRTISDEREKLIPGSRGAPVYRTHGAPFSRGPGRKVSLKLKSRDFYKNEIRIIDGKNWYQIPNKSWYQTWHKIPGTNSYAIYYDCWEKREKDLVETFWRGATPGKVTGRTITRLEQQRLIRAEVDGALQTLSGKELSFCVTDFDEKFSWAFDRQTGFSRGQLVIYKWKSENKGAFVFKNEDVELPVLFESKDNDRRFVGLSQGYVMVVGTDIFRDWLTGCNQQSDSKKVDLAAFYEVVPDKVLKIALFDSDSSELYVFRYLIEEQRAELVKKIKSDFALDHLTFDGSGDLILTAFERKTPELELSIAPGYQLESMLFDNASENAEFIEGKGFVETDPPQKLTGRFIFSKAFYQNIYVLRDAAEKAELIYSIYLDKQFFMRKFEINNPPSDFRDLPCQQLAELASLEHNKITTMTDNVPDYPDQFVKPESVCVAVFK